MRHGASCAIEAMWTTTALIVGLAMLFESGSVAHFSSARNVVPLDPPSQGLANQLLPRFEDYPASATYHGSPAPVRTDTAGYGRIYRTQLRRSARMGPNFAGAFTVVVWGCGSSCQIVAVIDARTGRLSKQTLHTTNGVEYRAESRLILADPVRLGNPPLAECVACGTPAAYLWTGVRFEPVSEGPHPHIRGDKW
jgi:hypothetical protein